MTATVYLHIGLPKTGTSALQVFFARNARAFLKHGIAYPWTRPRVATERLISSGNGARLARYGFRDQAAGAAARQGGDPVFQLRKALANRDESLLLSSEYFAGWDGDRFARFRDACAGYGRAVRIIVYLRHQADIIVNHYFQMLKRRPGFTEQVSDLASYADTYMEQRHYLNFADFLAMLASVFGADRVTVRPYRRSRLAGGSLMTDFLDCLGLGDAEGFDLEIPLVNPTPRQHEMQVRKILGIHNPSVAISDTFLDVVSRLYQSGGRRDVDDCNYLVDPALVERIRDRYRDCNERTCATWFAGAAPAEVFEERPLAPRIPFTYDTSDLESLVAVLGGLAIEALSRVEALEQQIRDAGRPRRPGAAHATGHLSLAGGDHEVH